MLATVHFGRDQLKPLLLAHRFAGKRTMHRDIRRPGPAVDVSVANEVTQFFEPITFRYSILTITGGPTYDAFDI